MGLFSRFKDRKDDSEQSLGSFTVTARVKSAYTASVLPKGGPGRLVKGTAATQQLSVLGIERAESFGSALPSPLANLAAQGKGASGNEQPSQPGKRPSVQYTHDDQFSQRLELYRGSISTVYRALCTQTQETVIVKVYDRAKMKPKNFARLEREVRLMKLLAGHPGVVRLHGSYEDDEHVTLVMEHCSAGDLFKTMLMHGGVLDEHWVATEVIAPLLRVLVALHKQHILHRDIKPENLFLTRKRAMVLGDFGLAIRCDEELPFTRSGTLDYMAPEVRMLFELNLFRTPIDQVLANPTSVLQEGADVSRDQLKAVGVRPYDEKVDVWATGILAYELLVGKPPFEVKNEAQTVNRILTCTNISLPARHSLLWADFVKQGLEKRPHFRPDAATLLEHPWLQFHLKKHAREAGHTPSVEEMLRSPLPTIPTFKGAQLPDHAETTIPAVPSLSRPGIVDMGRTVPEEAGPLPAPAARKQDGASGARRSASMGSQALESSIGQKPRLVNGAAERKHSLPQEHGHGVVHLTATSGRSGAAHHQSMIERSGSSFTNLVESVPEDVYAPGRAGYVHSGDFIPHEEVVAGGEDGFVSRAQGGMKTRVKHYFDRQKHTRGLAAAS